MKAEYELCGRNYAVIDGEYLIDGKCCRVIDEEYCIKEKPESCRLREFEPYYSYIVFLYRPYIEYGYKRYPW